MVSVRTYLNVLNGKTATAVALILFNLGAASFNCEFELSAAVNGTSSLLRNRQIEILAEGVCIN